LIDSFNSSDVPVEVGVGTHLVTAKRWCLIEVFKITLTDVRGVQIPVQFEIDGEAEATARWLADEVARLKDSESGGWRRGSGRSLIVKLPRTVIDASTHRRIGAFRR
jgi:hypothetical protein